MAMAPQPFQLHALDDGALGGDRQQAGNAKFGRFFDQPVGLAALDRREGEPAVGHGLLLRGRRFDGEGHALLARLATRASHSPDAPSNSRAWSPTFSRMTLPR